ncbi:hypothetical protein, partial [Pseudomonas aeruginosa]
GTLITAAGFLPFATAQSGTGEYNRSVFQVVTIPLVVSWFDAVVFVPYPGAKLLPDLARLHAQKHGGGDQGAGGASQGEAGLLEAVVALLYRHRHHLHRD